jgi:hypothetical protein
MEERDEFERMKKFKPLAKHTVGVSPIIPIDDDDEKFKFYNGMGESVYTKPPPDNAPTIDHGMDEDDIWAFGKSLYNQNIIKNTWSNHELSNKHSYAPFWGEKLCMPAWYKRNKIPKFKRHWTHRRGLEMIKMTHIMRYGTNPSKKERDEIREELINYVNSCYNHEELDKLKDVYVTDHEPIAKKLNTQNEEEDLDFYEYQRSIAEYNEGPARPKIYGAEKP